MVTESITFVSKWFIRTLKFSLLVYLHCFSSGSVVKNPPANVGATGDLGSIPGSGRSLGEGNGNPLQYSCLGNPTDRGAWWTTVLGVAKSQTQLSTHTHICVLWKLGSWWNSLADKYWELLLLYFSHFRNGFSGIQLFSRMVIWIKLMPHILMIISGQG